MPDVNVDVAAAASFMAAHARLLDRRRLDLLLGDGDAASVLAALEAYRNDDGGYGWGLEPDLRASGSQPIHALHVFEVIDECAPVTTPRAAELCDWLATVAFEDGGLPFVLPITDPAGCAPWFVQADPRESSLHGTAAVVAEAVLVARHDPAVASHPWLEAAVRYCLDAIAEAAGMHAYETVFALRLLDTLSATRPEAAGLLARLAGSLPASGLLPVAGGVEGEVLRPLDYSPVPGSALRSHLAPELVEAELDRLARDQQEDGGWEVDFASFSPAARVEWRAYATLKALCLLSQNGRVS